MRGAQTRDSAAPAAAYFFYIPTTLSCFHTKDDGLIRSDATVVFHIHEPKRENLGKRKLKEKKTFHLNLGKNRTAGILLFTAGKRKKK